MATLKQMSTVTAYVEDFEKVTAHLSAMLEEQRLGYFMNGLCGEIKRRVRTYDPNDLNRAVQLALDIEEEICKGDVKMLSF